ncbi:MAG TPA: cyclic nucleotide-binding domain-containing protein, partial [Lacipirellulaceae bacterium]|nr:cyclic nucleotide-binding domain-containing protein [Lacipirellulaceae bacterium]
MADDALTMLRGHEFFRGIADKHLEQLAQLCQVREFSPQTKVFEEFERAEDVYFIVDGRISLAICDGTGCRQISIVTAGDLLGWSPLVGRARLFDTARTATRVTTLVFPG